MKEALKQVSLLVERFERNIEAYRSPAYNETQLRREFIDPFFEALGWDVANKAGYAEQYKDIVHDSISLTVARQRLFEKDLGLFSSICLLIFSE